MVRTRTLHSGDETFGGEESNDFSNSSEIAHDWSKSEVEKKSEREDHDDVGDQSDGAEDSTPEMKIAEIDTLVTEICGGSNEKYASVLVAQSTGQSSTKFVKKNRATRTSLFLACSQPPSTKKKSLKLVTLKARLLVIAQLCRTL